MQKEKRIIKIYEIDQTANTPNVPYGSSFNVIIKTCLTPLVIQVSKSNNNKNKISHSVLSTKVQVEIKIDFIKRTLGKSLVEGPAKKGCLEYWSKMLKHLDNFIEKQKENNVFWKNGLCELVGLLITGKVYMTGL